MSENKNIDKKIDEAEAAVKKYASKDTVISIGGYEFTPAKLMIAFTIISSTLGAFYGAFEVYKSYQDMKSKIEKYVTPDLSEFDKRLILVEETSTKTNDYTRDIKNDIYQFNHGLIVIFYSQYYNRFFYRDIYCATRSPRFLFSQLIFTL
jgi:hypothetical protein